MGAEGKIFSCSPLSKVVVDVYNFSKIEDIDTPAVLVDLDIVGRNILRFQEYCNQHNLALRPHIKTHKSAELAKMQISAGAVGINCQKLSEAEVMATSGLNDILITYNIIGTSKLKRLRSLFDKVGKISVTADSHHTIKGLSGAFSESLKFLEVLVECDTGGRRCGVQNPEQAVELAKRIKSSPGLKFGGLMTYPAKGGTKEVQRFMSDTVSLMKAEGLDCMTITSGGSPDMWQAHKAPIVSEYRVGTYIYNDRSLVLGGTCKFEDCALYILATVVSAPEPGRAIIDAGSKILSSDLMGLKGYGHLDGLPESYTIVSLSEEHGHVNYPPDLEPLRVGQQLCIIPNHACVVSNLVNEIFLVSNGEKDRMLPVDARGCIV